MLRFFNHPMVRQVLPFAGAATLALLTALIPPMPRADYVLLAAALTAVLALSPVAWEWARPPAPLSVLPPLLFLLVVAILREATGGSGSGFGPLVLLSIFWVALYGTRWQLAAVIVGVGVVLGAPLTGMLGGDYGTGELRYTLIWLAVASLIGFTAQSLVGRERGQRRTLAEQRDFLDAMFDSAGSLVAVLELDGRVRRINPACERLGGYPEAEMVGRPFWELLISSEGLEAAARGWSERGPERLGGIIETPMVSRDGEHHTVHWTLATLRDQHGDPAAFVATGIDVTDRKRVEGELKQLAERDSLTGLLNRRRFEQALREHLTHIARYGRTGALLVLDVDGFKEVNDTLGHARGDELIVAIARGLDGELRAGDSVARLGGDEFAVLLPEADREQAETTAARLIEVARSIRIEGLSRGERGVAISLGTTVFAEHEYLDPEESLIAADAAMYEAKRGGGSRFHVAPAVAIER